MANNVKLGVNSNLGSVSLAFRDLAKKQLPFAQAVALTRIAQLARDEQRRQMPRRFDIRSKRVITAIAMQRAEKRDFPRSFALVGVRSAKDSFLVIHEEGGLKRATNRSVASPRDGARIAVPTKGIQQRRTSTGKIPKRLRPTVLRNREDVFVDKRGRIRFSTRKKKRGRRRGLVVAYSLKRSVRIKPRLRLFPTVRAVVASDYERVFRRELASAVKSAKRRIRKPRLR